MGRLAPARPFLRRTALWPGESLYSLLVRLAAINHYTVKQLTALCFQRPSETHGQWIDNAERPRRAETYERLSVFTGIPASDLFCATPNAFASVASIPGGSQTIISLPEIGAVSCLPHTVYRWLRQRAEAQFCPKCLRESPYHRLVWSACDIAICLRHRCLLCDACPACGRKVSVEAVTRATCNLCGSSLLSAHPASVRGQALGLGSQQVLHSWLVASPRAGDEWVASMPSRSTRAVFRLFEVLKSFLALDKNGSAWFAYDPLGSLAEGKGGVRDIGYWRLSPALHYALGATAFKALLNWPEGFFEFGEALSSAQLGRGDYFGYLHIMLARLRDSEGPYDFVWNALGQYNAWHYRKHQVSGSSVGGSINSSDSSEMTIGAAARRLGLFLPVAERLIETGYLCGADIPHTVRRDSVLTLGRIKATRKIPVKEAARLLNLSSLTVSDLAEAGVISPLPEDWFRLKDVLEFMNRLAVRVSMHGLACESCEHMDLLSGARLLAADGVDVATILRRVVHGFLRAYQCGPALNCGALVFRRADLLPDWLKGRIRRGRWQRGSTW